VSHLRPYDICEAGSLDLTRLTDLLLTVGGVAQWLGRRSFGWRTFPDLWFDRWPICWKSARYGPTNLANSAFHPSGVGKWVVITWITKVETIKRQTKAVYGCLVAGQSPWVRASTAQLIVCVRPSVCDTKSAAAAAVCWQFHRIPYLTYMDRQAKSTLGLR